MWVENLVFMHHLIFKKGIYMLLLGLSPLLFNSCNGGESAREEQTTANQESSESTELTEEEALADPMQVKGVGPIQQLTLEAAVDQQMAKEGQQIFEQMCTACHKIEERYVGPALKEVTTRRSPEWIMNMILNPEVMIKEDPIGKALLKEYLAPMANQNLTEEQARQILEYFRTLSEVDSLNHQS
ncbi:cytochrome c class i [Flammeovirgaceae bacterium 311]|nr:cytochrome c class i [Flammeovirgaceae bacterium 311]